MSQPMDDTFEQKPLTSLRKFSAVESRTSQSGKRDVERTKTWAFATMTIRTWSMQGLKLDIWIWCRHHLGGPCTCTRYEKHRQCYISCLLGWRDGTSLPPAGSFQRLSFKGIQGLHSHEVGTKQLSTSSNRIVHLPPAPLLDGSSHDDFSSHDDLTRFLRHTMCPKTKQNKTNSAYYW